MSESKFISTNFAAVLVYCRPPLVFGGMLFAVAVMLNQSMTAYIAGLCFLLTSMFFDLIDGWFAARYRPQAKLAHLADRIMDKAVYSMIFPVVAVGMMWRYQHLPEGANLKLEMLHVVLVLILCVTVLMRDNFAHFMRNFSLRRGEEEEFKEITRLRTMIAAPIGVLLYLYAFYLPVVDGSELYSWISWFGEMNPRHLIMVEILFLIINLGSIAGYCRKYGTACLDDLCLGDEVLRRRILSVFPNALTVMNALMGLLAIFFADQGRFKEAYLILLGAAFFDKLDGAVARKLGLTTPLPNQKQNKYSITLGGVLDDISDTVSFCIAPAIMFYFLMERFISESGETVSFLWVAIGYAVLGVIRLIFFILDRKSIPGFFKGLPVPAAALLVTAPLIMLDSALDLGSTDLIFWGWLCFWLMIGTSLLMNSYFIRYLHVGRLLSRNRRFMWFTIIMILSFMFTPYFGYASFFYMILYVFSPLYTWRISPEIAAIETRQHPVASS